MQTLGVDAPTALELVFVSAERLGVLRQLARTFAELGAGIRREVAAQGGDVDEAARATLGPLLSEPTQ